MASNKNNKDKNNNKQLVKINEDIINLINVHTQLHYIIPKTEVYSCIELVTTDKEYEMVYDLFHATIRNAKIISVRMIINPYLQALYLLKELDLKKLDQIGSKLLFHGTSLENFHSIAKHNFDHRRYGTKHGVKYGKGIAFTPESFYASHYSNKVARVKMMLLNKVLIGNHYLGSTTISVPKEGYDTTTNSDESVFIKFEDDAFYPIYAIRYVVYINNPENCLTKPYRLF